MFRDCAFLPCNADCAPGLHKVTTNGVDSCETCPEGQYCVGGSGTNEASSATDCPAGLATTFAGARSLQQCFTEAGFGRSSSRNSAGFVTLTGTQCAIGTYNVGGNTAGCQKCPAGLTTESPGSTSLADCSKFWLARVSPSPTLQVTLNTLTFQCTRSSCTCASLRATANSWFMQLPVREPILWGDPCLHVYSIDSLMSCALAVT